MTSLVLALFSAQLNWKGLLLTKAPKTNERTQFSSCCVAAALHHFAQLSEILKRNSCFFKNSAPLWTFSLWKLKFSSLWRSCKFSNFFPIFYLHHWKLSCFVAVLLCNSKKRLATNIKSSAFFQAMNDLMRCFFFKCK